LVRAIRQLCRGESPLHPTIARKPWHGMSRPSQKPPTEEPRTEREVEVLWLVAHGGSAQEPADDRVLREPPGRTHVSNIRSHLHLASRTQAALYALKEGLASLDDTDLSV